MDDLVRALSVAIETAREAGALLRREFHRSGGPRGSGDHADIDGEAEEVIQKRLLAAFPWNYLGEELGRRDTSDSPFRWLVDPNDGTKSYLKGWRGSAVSIAALQDGIPVLGVVYAFCYPDDDGDLIAWAEGSPRTRNGQPLTVRWSDDRLPPHPALSPWRGQGEGGATVPRVRFSGCGQQSLGQRRLRTPRPLRRLAEHRLSAGARCRRRWRGRGFAQSPL
jgi:hypothetical protein